MLPRSASMPQALTGGVVRPDELHVALGGGRGAEMADHRRRRRVDVVQVGEYNAVENVLIGRQILDELLGGEVAFGQCVQRRQTAGIGEILAGGDFEHRLGGTVGTRPHHARIGGDVARLRVVADHGTAGGAAQRGHGKRAGGGDEAGCGG